MEISNNPIVSEPVSRSKPEGENAEALTPAEKQDARDIFNKQVPVIEVYFHDDDLETGVRVQAITIHDEKRGLNMDFTIVRNPHELDDGSFVGPNKFVKNEGGTLISKYRMFRLDSDGNLSAVDRVSMLKPQEGRNGCYDIIQTIDQPVSDNSGRIVRFGSFNEKKRLLTVGEAGRRKMP